MNDVVVLEIPNVFAEFSRISRVCVLERRCVVSVPCLEVVFCYSPIYVSDVLLSVHVTMTW